MSADMTVLFGRLDAYADRLTTAERMQIAADMAAYVDQLLAGADHALRDLATRTATPNGLIAVSKAREAVAAAQPLLEVPRQRADSEHGAWALPGRVTRAATGSWAAGREEKDRG